MQNLNSEDPSVSSLVQAIATNIHTKPASMPTKATCLESLSNGFFGLQVCDREF
jgi:hypothetical protein